MKTVEHRAMIAAVLPEGERFSVIADTATDVPSEKPLNVMVGEKRKHEELATDEGIDATICEKEVLWRANFEEFVRYLRNKACVANVRSRLDDGAGIVLNAILEATRSTEGKVKIEYTVPLSIDAIFEEVIKSEGRSMTFERIRAAFGELGCNPVVGEIEESYSVDLKNIIEIAQNVEVESIVLKRYGREAYSMFRLLSKTGQLMESAKICGATFVEKKAALAILYNLWKDGYLQMQKVVAHGSQSQFLLWKVNKSSTKEFVLNEMFHATLNLTQRMTFEFEKEHEIVQGGETHNNRRKNVKILLESSLMKLDDLLMLFHDF